MTKKIDINSTLREYRNDLLKRYPDPDKKDAPVSVDRNDALRSSKGKKEVQKKVEVKKKPSSKITPPQEHNDSVAITDSKDGQQPPSPTHS